MTLASDLIFASLSFLRCKHDLIAVSLLGLLSRFSEIWLVRAFINTEPGTEWMCKLVRVGIKGDGEAVRLVLDPQVEPRARTANALTGLLLLHQRGGEERVLEKEGG